jgi:two-component system, LytTR family, sensor kinase
MNQFKKIEFGVVTGIFLLLLFSVLYPSLVYNVFELQDIYGTKFAQYNQVFDYYIHYLLPVMGQMTMVYVSFLLVNFVIVPEFLEKERWIGGLLLLLPLGGLYFLITIVCNSYYNGYLFGVYDTVRGAHMHFVKSAFITTVFSTLMFVVYYYVKKAFFQVLYNRFSTDMAFRQMMTEISWASGLFVVLFCLSFGDSRDLATIIFFFGPSQIAVFFILRYRVFPSFMDYHHNKGLLIRDLIFTILGCNVLMALITRAIGHRHGD